MITKTLSTRGRVIIPYELRKRHGLKKGDKVQFIDYGGVITIAPVSNLDTRKKNKEKGSKLE